DVDNPLVGPEGAAAVYGPQKGAGPDDVLLLAAALRRYARVLADDLGQDLAATPGAGAAGGLGAGAIAFLGAELRTGIELVLELVGFDRAVAGAALVGTGEGKLDAQSLRGKAPVGVARAAGAHGVPVVAVAGAVEVADRELRGAGFEGAHAPPGEWWGPGSRGPTPCSSWSPTSGGPWPRPPPCWSAWPSGSAGPGLPYPRTLNLITGSEADASMTDDLPRAAAAVVAAGRSLGLDLDVREFPDGTRTAADAARAIGCQVDQIVKSLLFVADTEPVLVLTSGGNRVDVVKVGKERSAAVVRKADAG